jgi:hypothetical protein
VGCRLDFPGSRTCPCYMPQIAQLLARRGMLRSLGSHECIHIRLSTPCWCAGWTLSDTSWQLAQLWMLSTCT